MIGSLLIVVSHKDPSIIFIIYINDLIQSIDVPVTVYADDTKLIFNNNTPECVVRYNKRLDKEISVI